MPMSPGRMLGFIATLLTCSSANAQSDKSLPGCEPPSELRIAMREQLDPKKFEGMKTYERMARRAEIIQALMERFPREAYPAHIGFGFENDGRGTSSGGWRLCTRVRRMRRAPLQRKNEGDSAPTALLFPGERPLQLG